MSIVPTLENELLGAAMRLEVRETNRPARSWAWGRRSGRLILALGALLVASGGAAVAARLSADDSGIRVSTSQQERDFVFAQFSALSDDRLRSQAAQAAGGAFNQQLAESRARIPARERELYPQLAVDPSRSRVLRSANPTIYVHVGDTTLCTEVRETGGVGGGGCGDPYPALGRGSLVGSTTSLPRHRTRITVLAPDRIERIKVELMDGSHGVLHATNNVATGVFRHSARSFSWIDDRGVPQHQCAGGRKPPACGRGESSARHKNQR